MMPFLATPAGHGPLEVFGILVYRASFSRTLYLNENVVLFPERTDMTTLMRRTSLLSAMSIYICIYICLPGP